MACTCGAELRQFWIWCDAAGTRHASRFEPSVGWERTVLASTPRDALVPLGDSGVPRHRVVDADDASMSWDGRCMAAAEMPTSAAVFETLAPAIGQ